MIQIFKLIYIATKSYSRIMVLFSLFLIITALEIMCLVAIAPFAVLAVNPKAENFVFLGLNFSDLFNSEYEPIILLSIVLLLLFLFKAVLSVVCNYMMFNFLFDMRLKIQSKLLQYYQSLSFPEFSEERPGKIITNILTLTSDFVNSSLRTLFSGIQDLILFFSIFLFLLFTDVIVVLSGVALILAFLGVYLKIVNNISKDLGRITNLQTDDMTQAIHDSLNSFRENRIYRLSDVFNVALNKAGKTYKKSQTKVGVIQVIPRHITELLIVGSMTAVVLFWGTEAENSNLIFAKLGVFAFAGLRLLPTVSNLSTLYARLYSQSDTVNRIHKMLETTTALNENVYVGPSLNWKKLNLNNIKFFHKGASKYIFNNFSFQIHRNNFIGIVGGSGSGKSTLCDLILGFQMPTSGQITIDDKQMADVTPAWQGDIAYVSQDPVIFSDSILFNVCLKHKIDSLEQERLEIILKQLNLCQLIANMDDGLLSKLGAGGKRLSGGQAQRINIARALFSDRNFLLFDEPLSALDHKNALAVQKAIEHYKGKKTIVIISHQSQIFHKADFILDLE